jgi:hypothetical protein
VTIEKNKIDMMNAYDCLIKRKQDVDQEYHSLIEDFKKYINITDVIYQAIRNFLKKISKVNLSLPEFNAENLTHKMYLIPDVIFCKFLKNFIKKFLLIFCLFA